MAKRVPASMRTRQSLSDVIEGRLSSPAGREKLVKLATRLIIEETLEAEARDAVGRDYYEHGAEPGSGYRNGYRPGRLNDPDDEPPRASVRRGAPALEDHSERLWREARAQADVRRHDPRRRALAGRQGDRIRAPPARCRQTGSRSGIRGRNKPQGKALERGRP